MTHTVSAILTDEDSRFFTKRLAETHKSQSDFLRQIIHTYIDFEKAGYLNADGDKIKKLETEIQLREKLRQVEANRMQDKIDFEKELAKLKADEAKEKARNRAARNQPKVDWGNVTKGTGDSFDMGDGFNG